MLINQPTWKLFMLLLAASPCTAVEDTSAPDAPLVYREDWRETSAAIPVTQEHLQNKPPHQNLWVKSGSGRAPRL